MGIASREIQQGGNAVPSSRLPGRGAEITARQQLIAQQRARPMQPLFTASVEMRGTTPHPQLSSSAKADDPVFQGRRRRNG